MSKILEEKKNDLITRAEELVKIAETRELTEDEAMELAEIRDDVKKIKEALGLEDEMREILEGEAKPKNDNVPTEEGENMGDKDRACGADKEKRALDEEKMFEAYIRGQLNERANNMEKGDNGAVIPQTIADKIIKKVYDVCPILDKSSKYNVKGTLTIPYYDESETAINVGYQTEFSAITSAVGQFTSTVTLTGFLAGALAKVSRSLINNSQFNIVDHVVDLMAEHIARFIDIQCCFFIAVKHVGAAAKRRGFIAYRTEHKFNREMNGRTRRAVSLRLVLFARGFGQKNIPCTASQPHREWNEKIYFTRFLLCLLLPQVAPIATVGGSTFIFAVTFAN